MSRICLPSLRVPHSTCACHNYPNVIRSPFNDDQNRSFHNTDPCHEKSFLSKSSIWHRLYQTHTGSSYRRSCYYCEVNSPKNDLDFRLRTCYNHAQETFAPKARIVVQAMTICQKQNQLNSNQASLYPFKIVYGNRKEHFNEAAKGQHIASDHFANGKHGYSRTIAGAIPVD